MTDQEIVGCLATEFSKYLSKYRAERIEKAFQIAKQELGDSINAYVCDSNSASEYVPG